MNKQKPELEVLLASKHQKEIALEKALLPLGVRLHVANNFDTDQFGTFSGEIERPQSPLETCKLKAKAALLCHPYDIAMASEGSFFPHPMLPFSTIDEEWLVWIERTSALCVVEKMVSFETNFSEMEIRDLNAPIDEFLLKVRFPSHALMLQGAQSQTYYLKGCHDYQTLITTLKHHLKTEPLLLKTDMRAMHNPTRMQVIEQAGHKLTLRLQRHCPKCQSRGFGQTGVYGALKCSFCLGDTSLYEGWQYTCCVCAYQTFVQRQDKGPLASPDYCYTCNP